MESRTIEATSLGKLDEKVKQLKAEGWRHEAGPYFACKAVEVSGETYEVWVYQTILQKGSPAH